MLLSASSSPDLHLSIKPGYKAHLAMALPLTPRSMSTNQVLSRDPHTPHGLGAVSVICVTRKGGAIGQKVSKMVAT